MTSYTEALDKELNSWLGTPYVPGQAMRGPRGGVDCRYFVCCVMDNLYNLKPRPPLPVRVAKDTGMHNIAKAVAALDAVRGRWPSQDIPLDRPLLPGDVVAVRAGGLMAPSHALIVGGDGKKFWHSMYGAGVCYTNRSGLGGTIVGVYRPLEVNRWLL